MEYPYIKGVSEKFGITSITKQTDIPRVSYIDYDLFYIYLADAMSTIPSMAEFVEKQYLKDKFLYYSAAIASPQYHSTLMTDGDLEKEVLTKRAFGILLAARSNDELRAKLCNLFIAYFPPMRKLKKTFTFDVYLQLDNQYQTQIRVSRESPFKARYFRFFGAYIIDNYLGLNQKTNEHIIAAKAVLISEILDGEKANQSKLTEKIHAINARDYIRTPAYFRGFRELIQDEEDIKNLFLILRGYTDDSRRCEHDKKFAKMHGFIMGNLNEVEQQKLLVYGRRIMDALALSGKNLESLISKQKLSQEELLLIFNTTSLSYQQEREAAGHLVEIHASDYLLEIIIYLIAKAIHNDRDFYYQNSAESQFIETKAAQKENAELKELLESSKEEHSALLQQVGNLNNQIDLLKQELLKEERDATKPLLGEISVLKGYIATLESKLQEETEKIAELARLREFVFDMQQGNDIQLEEIPLDSYIEGKKIYIFGGHINWRNRLKQKYPKLEVLDGHNVSFDEQKLLGADMVLMNTSNMSHALYYKIIDVLRKNNVPFDYLGKYSNPNLLEQEIAEALLRKR